MVQDIVPDRPNNKRIYIDLSNTHLGLLTHRSNASVGINKIDLQEESRSCYDFRLRIS